MMPAFVYEEIDLIIYFIAFYRSYWAFKNHFPEQAEILLNNLDASYKRSLMSLSNSGSSNSLNVMANARSSSVSPRTARPVMSATGKDFPFVYYRENTLKRSIKTDYIAIRCIDVTRVTILI